MPYFVGVMSGTSLDGIDAVLVSLSDAGDFNFIHARTFPFSEALHQRLKTLITHPQSDLITLGEAHIDLGQQIGHAVNALLADSGIDAKKITAIGSHGQTLYHAPSGHFPFSLQIGDPNQIAQITHITTVSDFRGRDIANGGQGAPLVPAFHQALFRCADENRAIINIGGISNITYLPASQSSPVLGFDCGPGNVLLDLWTQRHLGKNYDDKGRWGRSGHLIPELLEQLLDDPFFRQSIPKSTGREYFNNHWLQQKTVTCRHQLDPADIQATLTELTARSIADHIHQFSPETQSIYLCGGGVHNHFLINRLQSLLPRQTVTSTQTLGLHPDWVEACAFAWLAARTIHHQPGNLPSVTGAHSPVILGSITPNGTVD